MFSADNKLNGNRDDGWFCLKHYATLYDDDNFTVLGRAHALPPRTLLFLLTITAVIVCKYMEVSLLSNPPPLLGACVASTFPSLGIVFDSYTHDNH